MRGNRDATHPTVIVTPVPTEPGPPRSVWWLENEANLVSFNSQSEPFGEALAVLPSFRFIVRFEIRNILAAFIGSLASANFLGNTCHDSPPPTLESSCQTRLDQASNPPGTEAEFPAGNGVAGEPRAVRHAHLDRIGRTAFRRPG